MRFEQREKLFLNRTVAALPEFAGIGPLEAGQDVGIRILMSKLFPFRARGDLQGDDRQVKDRELRAGVYSWSSIESKQAVVKLDVLARRLPPGKFLCLFYPLASQ